MFEEKFQMSLQGQSAWAMGCCPVIRHLLAVLEYLTFFWKLPNPRPAPSTICVMPEAKVSVLVGGVREWGSVGSGVRQHWV